MDCVEGANLVTPGHCRPLCSPGFDHIGCDPAGPVAHAGSAPGDLAQVDKTVITCAEPFQQIHEVGVAKAFGVAGNRNGKGWGGEGACG